MRQPAAYLGIVERAPPSLDMLRTPKGFSIGSRDAAGVPLPLDEAGRVIEPVAAYLLERRLWQDRSIGSLGEEAYALKAWFEWLAWKGLDWRWATDDDLLAWATYRERRHPDGRDAAKARNQTCLNVLARFYRFANTKMLPFSIGLSANPLERGVSTAIQVEVARGNSRGQDSVRTRVRYATVRKKARGTRPTPSLEQVEEILNFLMDRPCPYEAERDYLCARWMAEAGLRAQGVAGLTIRSLEAALREAGWRHAGIGIAAIAEATEARGSLRRFLQGLEEDGRTVLVIGVTEKGKHRSAPAPISLVWATLDYVWDQRHSLTRRLKARGYKASDGLWLSKRDGLPLRTGSIGDKVKDGFKAVGAPGSGHRLRARFAQNLLRQSLAEAHGRGAKFWNPEDLLLRVADAMGHADIKSLREYLNGALRELNLVGNLPVVEVPPEHQQLIQAIVEAISGADQRAVALFLKELLGNRRNLPEA